MVHGAGQCFDEFGGLARKKRPNGEFLSETAALDVFQCQIGFAVLFADIVNLHDVGMLQASDGLGFAAETSQRFDRRLTRRANALEGDKAIESFLPGFPDDAHAALSQHFEQLVSANEASWARGRHRRGGTI